jgi:hypothetical protein
MLRFLKPRFHGQYKENGLIRGSFIFEDDDDSWAPHDRSLDGHTYTGLSVADAGTGLVDVTFGTCRHVEVLEASIRNTAPGTFGNVRQIELPPMTAAIALAGLFRLAIYKEDGTSGVPALADPVDGAYLSLAIWIDK